MWIARDYYGKLFIYTEKPVRTGLTWRSSKGPNMSIPEYLFPNLTYDDDPIEVELYDKNGKLKLIEDVVDYCRRFGISDVTECTCYEHLFAKTNEK